jgi:small-conductance mechanosensitive channel
MSWLRPLRFLACLLIATAFSGSALAEEAAAPAESDVAEDVKPVNSRPEKTSRSRKAVRGSEAELIFMNRTIAVFRAHIVGISPDDRARRALARIDERVPRGGPLKVTTQPSVLGTMVQLDGETIFFIAPDDVDVLRDESQAAATKLAVARFEQALAEASEGRDAKAMWRGLMFSALASLAAMVLWRILRWARRSVQRRLLRWSSVQVQRLRIGNTVVLRRERVLTLIRMALTALNFLLASLLIYEWLSIVLAQFPFSRPWGEKLNDFLIEQLQVFALAIVSAVPGVLTAAVIFWIAYTVSQGFNTFLERIQGGKIKAAWMEPDLALPTRRIVTVLVWIFAVAMAFPYLPGSQTEAFKGMSVLIGLMVSLGASSLVGQAFSGLILTYGRVYRRGDFVRIGEHQGTVVDVGIFTTRMRTGMGEELTLSNATILGGTTSNFSRMAKDKSNGKGFMVEVKVTVGYDTPWRQVHALLALAAQRTEGILSDPAPKVFQTALTDWYAHYRVVCTASPERADVRAELMSALHAQTQDVFNEFGVQLMSPQYFEDPPVPKVVPPDRWYAAPAQPPAGKDA